MGECELYMEMCAAIKMKRSGMLTRGVIVWHNNARAHVARTVQGHTAFYALENFGQPSMYPEHITV
jgi:hypothetical protein